VGLLFVAIWATTSQAEGQRSEWIWNEWTSSLREGTVRLPPKLAYHFIDSLWVDLYSVSPIHLGLFTIQCRTSPLWLDMSLPNKNNNFASNAQSRWSTWYRAVNVFVFKRTCELYWITTNQVLYSDEQVNTHSAAMAPKPEVASQQKNQFGSSHGNALEISRATQHTCGRQTCAVIRSRRRP